MKPMTLYWKNHATTDARPTVRKGVSGPSAKTIFDALDSCPPPLTCDEFITIASFSRGIVLKRTTTA